MLKCGKFVETDNFWSIITQLFSICEEGPIYPYPSRNSVFIIQNIARAYDMSKARRYTMPECPAEESATVEIVNWSISLPPNRTNG